MWARVQEVRYQEGKAWTLTAVIIGGLPIHVHRESHFFVSPEDMVWIDGPFVLSWYIKQPPKVITFERHLKVVYLFAGVPREGDMKWWFQRICGILRVSLYMLEMDICRDKKHDLLQTATQDQLKAMAASGVIDVLIVSPDCSTFSRARHFQPTPRSRPLRSKASPFGLEDGLTAAEQDSVRDGNIGVLFSFDLCKIVHENKGIFLYEHPEYLGKVNGSDVIPTSSFLLPDYQVLKAVTGCTEFAIHQCRFGAPFAKPTRFASTAHDFRSSKLAKVGPILLSSADKYLGPLPFCGHQHPSRNNGPGVPYTTGGSEAYPVALCGWLVRHIVQSWLNLQEQHSALDLSGADEVVQ
jgi:hypothetical protein